MYVNVKEKSMNFSGAQGHPSSFALFQTRSAVYLNSKVLDED
jgi:hypothetical protein